MNCNNEADSQQVVHYPPISKIKGHPKRKHIKDEKELYHNISACELYKGEGHNIITRLLKKRRQTRKKKKSRENTNLNSILHSKV